MYHLFSEDTIAISLSLNIRYHISYHLDEILGVDSIKKNRNKGIKLNYFSLPEEEFKSATKQQKFYQSTVYKLKYYGSSLILTRHQEFGSEYTK